MTRFGLIVYLLKSSEGIKMQDRLNNTYQYKDYIESIAEFNHSRPDMVAVGNYNYEMIDIFNDLKSLNHKHLLDIGASPHGYALERALFHEVSSYTGIGLALQGTTEVCQADRVGKLIGMNAENLAFDNASFDLIITLSTFEHFFNIDRVLTEMYRVLKPGGSVLINFQPVWTCSYGHHLHHVPNIDRLIPPWSHLLCQADEMRQLLQTVWPLQSPMSLDETIEWIYHSDEINRIDIKTILASFHNCSFEIEWLTPLPDFETENKLIIAEYLSKILPYSSQDLMTRGYSLMLNKK
jgi:SAM-dependent methyltransferase